MDELTEMVVTTLKMHWIPMAENYETVIVRGLKLYLVLVMLTACWLVA
jgi:hypothetical protein